MPFGVNEYDNPTFQYSYRGPSRLSIAMPCVLDSDRVTIEDSFGSYEVEPVPANVLEAFGFVPFDIHRHQARGNHSTGAQASKILLAQPIVPEARRNARTGDGRQEPWTARSDQGPPHGGGQAPAESCGVTAG